jgi:hypothetical protein
LLLAGADPLLPQLVDHAVVHRDQLVHLDLADRAEPRPEVAFLDEPARRT